MRSQILALFHGEFLGEARIEVLREPPHAGNTHLVTAQGWPRLVTDTGAVRHAPTTGQLA